VLAEVFGGPMSLNLREEISPASKSSATVRHGEKLDVIQVRRRFVRVRTPRGELGWTDSRHLLTLAEMGELQQLARRAATLPSQGEATVYEVLNVHTEPLRQAPSFFQITEKTRVDVVEHRVVPRAAQPPIKKIEITKPAPPARKKRKEPEVPPPPRPPAPGLPGNWIELSKTKLPEPPPDPAATEAEKKKKRRRKPKRTGPPLEDWYLVRAKDGRAGWALARNLVMAIPDEVAQYSEGARITSYFPLATVPDGDQIKHHWLWTTSRENGQPYEFDSFRVFTWVVRKHRYETAYIERNVEGYYPVSATAGSLPSFTLLIRENDGELHRKSYIMEGYMVRKVKDEIVEDLVTQLEEPLISQVELPDEEEDAEEEPSWGQRMRSWTERVFSRN
jgi:hypothetical protein